MINIAIDGHAGSGKSSVAEGLANRLGFKLLNTGEIYRSLACRYYDENWGEPSEEKLEKLLANLIVEIRFEGKKQFVYVDEICYKNRLRDEEISELASQISVFKTVRDKILYIQRDFAQKYDCILEGRDIQTVVLPNADVKIFLTASQEVRAKRRYYQLKDNTLTYEHILEDLKNRDWRDEHREIAPLKPAKDAIIIDNTDIDLQQTIDKCYEIIIKSLS